jgi:ATP-dependent DNA helicase 2 subunit 1
MKKTDLIKDYYVDFGTNQVILKKKEIEEIKQIQDIKEFTLLGFKPLSSLKWYHNLRTSIFIYPDNEQVSNSTIFCDAMIKELHESKQIAICRFKPSEKRSYRMCALLPQLEHNSEGTHTPPGFNMIILPFSEEVRNVEEEYYKNFDLALNKIEQGSDEFLEYKYLEVWNKMKTEKKIYKEYQGVDNLGPEEKEKYINELMNLNPQEEMACNELIEAFTIDHFSPNYFENPEIQKFYKNLQALALNHEHVEEIEDLIQPNDEDLEMNRDVIDQFSNMFKLNGDPERENKKIFKNKKMARKSNYKLGVKRKYKEEHESKSYKSVTSDKRVSSEMKENFKGDSIVEEQVFVSDSI